MPSVPEVSSSFRSGTGEPLVLVHIGANPWLKWEPVLPLLTPHFDVFVPVLPGFPGGPPLPADASLRTMVDAVEAAMDEAGIETAHIAGNSMGGWLAMELADRGRARTALALSPGGGWPENRFGRLRRFFLWNWRLNRTSGPLLPFALRFSPVRRWGMRLVVANPKGLTATQAVHIGRDTMDADWPRLLEIMREESLPAYPDPGVPTVLAWCEQDRITPLLHDSPAWRRAVPHAEFRVLSGLGHIPMFDAPELLARMILELAERGNGAPAG